MEVVFFCPSSGGPLAETKWVALSVQSPFTHTVTLTHFLSMPHTLSDKLNPISDIRKNRLFLCQPLLSCSTAPGCLRPTLSRDNKPCLKERPFSISVPQPLFTRCTYTFKNGQDTQGLDCLLSLKVIGVCYSAAIISCIN